MSVYGRRLLWGIFSCSALGLAASFPIGCGHTSTASTTPTGDKPAPEAAAPPVDTTSPPLPLPPSPPPSTAKESEPSTESAGAKAPDTAAPESDANPRPVARRPKADRERSADGIEKITFDDLILGMQADMVFRPWMLEVNDGRAKELEGKQVRLAGKMWGGVESGEKNKDFILLRNQECKFGPGGQADHLAKVFLKKGHTIAYTPNTVRVEGTLRIEPETATDDSGNTWSIYKIEDAVATEVK